MFLERFLKQTAAATPTADSHFPLLLSWCLKDAVSKTSKEKYLILSLFVFRRQLASLFFVFLLVPLTHIAMHSLFTCLAISLFKCNFIALHHQTALAICLLVPWQSILPSPLSCDGSTCFFLQSIHSIEIVTGHSLRPFSSFCPTCSIEHRFNSGFSHNFVECLTGVGA